VTTASGIRIGIDLGGTKIAGLAIARDGRTLAQRRTATPQGDYDATVRTIAEAVRAIETEIGTTATVGVGIPGTISPRTDLVKNANSTCLIGQPLGRDLSKALDRPVRIANDADCFALSEATDGAAAGARSVFGVIIGTGCGGGLVYEGLLIQGPNAIAGEWGHNPLPWPRAWDYADERPGPLCYCGKHGCIETYVAGPGLARDHLAATGRDLPSEAIVAAADGGDAQARATMDRYVDRLARALSTIINIFDPEVIVLGGGLSQVPLLYRAVPERWKDYLFCADASSTGGHTQVETRLLPPRFGDASGVRGAAWLWPAER
jgi:fructokinase